jgi:pimeloyl-ACP methyl ester carboxylesterase
VGGPPPPDLPRDGDVISEADLDAYVAALTRNGFFGPDSWYMNGKANGAYAARAANGGKLAMPVLFLHGAHDYTCETLRSRLAEPMRRDCPDLTEVVVKSGHWMAQEKPVEVNAALARWLATRLADYWPSASYDRSKG